MQKYFAAAALLLIMLVISRVLLLKSKRITAFKFGALDKKDYIIPPFAQLYIFLVLAKAGCRCLTARPTRITAAKQGDISDTEPIAIHSAS